MKEYQKIPNLFKFDEAHRVLEGLNEPFNTLKDIQWVGVEKVDGTNIRIHWDGYQVEIAGRTERAEIPEQLKTFLEAKFKTKETEYVFEQMFGDTEVYIFGEGYGNRINGGTTYLPNYEVGFIVFDVNIGGWDLKREDINDVATKLGLPYVPTVFEGTIEEAIEFMKGHPVSALSGLHEMEGIVLTPKGLQMYDNKRNMIKAKCKYKDIAAAKYEEWKGKQGGEDGHKC